MLERPQNPDLFQNIGLDLNKAIEKVYILGTTRRRSAAVPSADLANSGFPVAEAATVDLFCNIEMTFIVFFVAWFTKVDAVR
ncbi:uncharacterized protein PSFLO_00131 [Pseudozyma flocculosa]|uniref:Uncharacterized protein n=1 Tax=Pseudozyma flocculosa TaxID=84751 RepID=A0A5C3ES25_9BASI|nr:uncharacterized protein PSFLO_00131 [Pseudozyma flocculosa]